MGEVSLSTIEFRALSSESRTKMLKMLAERNFTLSELSVKIGMAAPTVKQHASILVDSGIIELRDEGRKWKYYALTRKGKEILNAQRPQQTNILIVLSSTIIVALFGFALLSSNLGVYSPGTVSSTGFGDGSAAPAADVLRQESDMLTAPSAAPNASGTGGCMPAFEVEYSTSPEEGMTASEYYAEQCYINTSAG